jgi:hypothetical protein
MSELVTNLNHCERGLHTASCKIDGRCFITSQGYPYTRIRNLLTIECTKRKTKHCGNRQPEIGDITLEFDIENSSTKSLATSALQ